METISVRRLQAQLRAIHASEFAALRGLEQLPDASGAPVGLQEASSAAERHYAIVNDLQRQLRQIQLQ